MKFIHIADMHFDSPFVNLSDKNILGDLRRLEQRKALKKIIEYTKQNNIEYIFISGDLYEQKYIKESTIEYINQQFQEIPNTQIFISPGNHDPNIKNSYYQKFKWSKNVTIFSSKIQKIETEKANIYGYGYSDFYCTKCGIEEIEINDFTKPNILIIHATLNGASQEEKQYNPISQKTLKEKKFDYIALGHIHKPYYKEEENQNIIYPGSTISLGFDELGKHGMIVGEINQKIKKIEFIPLDTEEFKEKEIDITNILSKEELIEKINETEIKNNEYIKIILKGNRNFEINKYELIKYIENERIIKIKDNTQIAYNLEKISKENTLKGIYIKKMLEKLKQPELTKEEKSTIEKAIEIGLEALK